MEPYQVVLTMHVIYEEACYLHNIKIAVKRKELIIRQNQIGSTCKNIHYSITH